MLHIRPLVLLFLLLAGGLSHLCAGAATFAFRGESKEKAFLTIKGDIEPGDYSRMMIYLSQEGGGLAAMRWLTGRMGIWIESDGGDVEEALKIARWVRETNTPVFTLRCQSACFYILAAAVDRAMPGRVTIHRPYFGRTAAQSMDLDEARARYKRMSEVVYGTLDSYEVPRHLIEKMRSMASTEVYTLNEEDKAALGKRQPWYEQHLIANCGLDKAFDAQISREVREQGTSWIPSERVKSYRESVRECTARITFAPSEEAYLRLMTDFANSLQRR